MTFFTSAFAERRLINHGGGAEQKKSGGFISINSFSSTLDLPQRILLQLRLATEDLFQFNRSLRLVVFSVQACHKGSLFFCGHRWGWALSFSSGLPPSFFSFFLTKVDSLVSSELPQRLSPESRVATQRLEACVDPVFVGISSEPPSRYELSPFHFSSLFSSLFFCMFLLFAPLWW